MKSTEQIGYRRKIWRPFGQKLVFAIEEEYNITYYKGEGPFSVLSIHCQKNCIWITILTGAIFGTIIYNFL